MSLGKWEKESLERPIIAAGQLLVEGRVPEMFFREMSKACGLEERLEVRTFGDIGKDTLQTYLGLFCQKAVFRERVQKLGIIRDAESGDAIQALASILSAVEGFNRESAPFALPIPNQLAKLTPMASGKPQLGVFVLPDCQRPGMLETLCLEAIEEWEQDQDSKLMPCVRELFACLNKRGHKPANPTKAQFAGYALARDVIDPQLGRSAQQGAIPWKAAAFDPLRAYLKSIAEA